MRLLRIAAASSAVGLALTATMALAQGGYPGIPGYGPPAPYGAPYAPPGAMPGGYPAMPPGQPGPMAGPYAGMPGAGPMLPPGGAPNGSTPMVDPSQIYGSGSSGQGQPSSDPSQAYPGSVPGGPTAPSAMPGGPSAPSAMPGGPMAGPAGPAGPMAGPMGPSGPGGPAGMSTIPGMAPMPNGVGVNAVPGMPPVANAQAPVPPGSINPMAAAGQPVAGPSGAPSMQASPASQAPPPPTQNAASTDTVHITDADNGGIALDPTPIRYPVNRPITWINTSSTIVQVASEDGSTFDSGPMAPGDTYVYTPNLIGSVYYRDKLHPWVRGVVVAVAVQQQR